MKASAELHPKEKEIVVRLNADTSSDVMLLHLLNYQQTVWTIDETHDPFSLEGKLSIRTQG